MSQTIGKANWTEYKDLLDKKNPNWQHDDRGSDYYLFFEDGSTLYTYVLPKTDPKNSDQIEWEDVYMSRSNFSVGGRPYAFATGDFEFKGSGIFATIPAGQTVDLDVLVANMNTYVNGGEFYTEDSVIGDYIEAMVVDKDNLLGYGAGFVLKQWIEKWYIAPHTLQKLATPYAGVIPQGMHMRAKYHSTGGVDVKVIGNYYFHQAI